jgi:hypothetical protein
MPRKPTAFVAYLRVSTARQGESGLGLEAQRAAVEAFSRQHGATIIRLLQISSGRVIRRWQPSPKSRRRAAWVPQQFVTAGTPSKSLAFSRPSSGYGTVTRLPLLHLRHRDKQESP